jgi:hypothetical protein
MRLSGVVGAWVVGVVGVVRVVGVVGVDQIEVEMARAVVGDVLDLAPHPQVAPAGEGPEERLLHPVIEGTYRKDAGPLLGPALPGEAVCALPVVARLSTIATVHWRRLRIEELTRIP